MLYYVVEKLMKIFYNLSFFRVHQFTKVEMFACCNQEESFSFFQELVKIQEELFEELELWFKVLEMPPHELGSPAYRY